MYYPKFDQEVNFDRVAACNKEKWCLKELYIQTRFYNADQN